MGEMTVSLLVTVFRRLSLYRRCSWESSRWGISAFLCIALMPGLFAQSLETPAQVKPAARIDLSNLNYPQLPRIARLGDTVHLSLLFLDARHVLLTFNEKKLVRRSAECPPTHDDRIVRALVIEVPSGKVIRQTEWYLHDHRRYLWPLSNGTFLLRKLNDLYLVDSLFRERLLTSSPQELLWVSVTPDKAEIMLETAESGTPAMADEKAGEEQKKGKPKFQLKFLDVKTLAIHRTIELDQMVSLEGTSEGYADSLQKGDLWLIRFGPTPTERRNIARVRSRMVPRVFYSSDHSLLIGRTPAGADYYSVTAFTLNGRRLWQQHWDDPRYWPAVSHSEDNSRFGVSSLSTVAPRTGPVDYDDVNRANNVPSEDGVEQHVQVFETASGKPLLSITVSPAVLNGQNFSLSPDGRRAAVLRDSSLEVYELPAIAEEERAKYSALKADVPGLYVVSSKSDVESVEEPEPAAEGETNESAQFIANDAPDPSPAREAAADTPQAGTERMSGTAETIGQPANGGSAPSSMSFDELPTIAENHEVPLADALLGPEGEVATTLKVKTRAVVVDVVVTDSKGHPIKGLGQQDFQVSEENHVQDIRSFREVSGTAEKSASDAPAPASISSDVFTNAQLPDSGGVTLVLLDLLNTPTSDQQYAREELVKFLKSKAGKTPVAVAALTSDKAAYVQLIHGFTINEDELLAAVDGKKGAPRAVAWKGSESSIGNAITNVSQLSKGEPMGGWKALEEGLEKAQAHEQASDTSARVGVTLDGLGQVANYLSGIQGRKNVVWLSGSFPFSISQSAADPLSENRNYLTEVKRVTNLLADAQIAVYPVDVRGIAGGGMSAADNVSLGLDRTTTTSSPISSLNQDISPNQALLQRNVRELATQSSEWQTLNQFAADTGGMAFYNSNGIADAISTATEQGSNYYTLSYTPTNKNYDGKFRRIKVILAQKGYRLHYRQGYFAVDNTTPEIRRNTPSSVNVAAMQHGSPLSHQIRFAVRVVPIAGKKVIDRTKSPDLLGIPLGSHLPNQVEVQHYGIDYAVDSSDLHFVKKDEVHQAMLNFIFAAFGSDGKQLTGQSSVWTSDLTPSIYQDVINGGARIHQEVVVPTAAASLRLGLIDQVSNRLGTIELPLPVPVPKDVPRIVKHSLPEVEAD